MSYNKTLKFIISHISAAAFTGIIPNAGLNGLVGTLVSSYNINPVPPMEMGPNVSDSSRNYLCILCFGTYHCISSTKETLFADSVTYRCVRLQCFALSISAPTSFRGYRRLGKLSMSGQAHIVVYICFDCLCCYDIRYWKMFLLICLIWIGAVLSFYF